ncbi:MULTISPECIES: hypothetical protein [unclassified Beijerinckia]|uniref:hypothetical protein n=1 Tax=unclassified Beijerinckia TaxID=2638183 RepID=UPI00147CD812|nr:MULTISPECIES: hypothetical protein [unclassified Beijerinckia]MDH7795168.1 hypothetical protein [Beijerinckia sp. GAS462]
MVAFANGFMFAAGALLDISICSHPWSALNLSENFLISTGSLDIPPDDEAEAQCDGVA